nr:hypothetical protein [uncultured Rhodoferax sp.]
MKNIALFGVPLGGVSYGFYVVLGTHTMCFVGGAVGLAIGNIIKYHLGKRYVCQKEAG